MPRTRDFVLALVVIVFLVVGVGSALLNAVFPNDDTNTVTPVQFSETTLGEYSGSVPNNTEEARAARIVAMREQIAASGELFIYEGDTEPVPEETEPVVQTGVLRCDTYVPFVRPWNGSEYTFAIEEGARVLLQDVPQVATATGTQAARRVAAILPLNPLVSATPNCLQTDVIGFTAGGALIRNSDVLRYSALSANNLIGYALDGFPIYGPTSADVDQCGGTSLNGQYRYHVATVGDSLLNCLTAVPYQL